MFLLPILARITSLSSSFVPQDVKKNRIMQSRRMQDIFILFKIIKILAGIYLMIANLPIFSSPVTSDLT
jgi:hypothetical protein